MWFTVAPVSNFKVIILVNLMSNACLYELNLCGTEVLLVEFNKIFLLLFVDTICTVPHRHSVHPYLIAPILLYIVELSLWSGALEFQLHPLWLPCTCAQEYLSKYEGIG